MTHAGTLDSPMSIPAVFDTLLSFHFQSPAVIPAVFNRESTAFPMQDHVNEGTKEKDAGFPLTLSPTFVIGETGGHDRGDRRA